MNRPDHRTQGIAILVVDDEESLRDTFQFFLLQEGYSKVSTATDYEQAVEAIADGSFDLIISDIVLEGKSGIDFLKKVRDLGLTCPVVMITGYPNVDTAAQAVRLGAFDYLPKPVDKEALLRTARLALEQQRLRLDKQRAEKEREHYRDFLETIFKSVSNGIITVDETLRIMKMNPAAKQLFNALRPGISPSDSFDSLCDREELLPLRKDLLSVLETGREISRHRYECTTVDAGKRLLDICISPLRDKPGHVAGAVMVLRDVSNPTASQRERRHRFHRLVGQSDAMQAVYTLIENVGRVDLTVLITGESGTGKELVADALHLESRRKAKPLIKVDCTAIPENLLESELFGHKKGAFTGADRDRMGRILQAEGGTLFLDEIGDISPMMQLRLLRFLQESTFYPVGRDHPIKVDVRVIAATNADLKKKVRQGTFREDLYFRLRVIDVMLPPLRERKGDIALLTYHFVEEIAAKVEKPITGISDQALAMLIRYHWPGNVRELEHVLERACVLSSGPTISTAQLPGEIENWTASREEEVQVSSPVPKPWACPLPVSPEPQVQAPMEERILAALKRTGGNKAKASRLLGIDRTTLYRKIKELHIDLSVLDL